MAINTAEFIADKLERKIAVLRIHDESSATPLTINGFTATSREFSPSPSGTRWKRDYQYLRGNRAYLKDRDELEGIVKHVTGGWGDKEEAEGGSKWISTSGDLEWAIYEIARRLSIFQRSEVELSLIKHEKFPRSFKGIKDIQVDPLPLLNRFLQNRQNGDKKLTQQAIHFANASNEILYFGKIFPKFILETTVWTYLTPGFELPEYFYKPRESWGVDECWINRLVWTPSENLSYTEVKQRIEQRREVVRVEDETVNKMNELKL
ncbi:uncharacterized protein I303_105164 [Kwoniella dejecticola CBS 10117]|uniref:Uncharacterized protein n=1 Tax=Kwoniella dejecticola CBS 10117 TaxID=1296121 RepID=A0A1A6A3A1_9TREE|nr:uncharacterized protein I303_05390 [Kwoniella dejecticola CBS 10117]OBR84531.1 hypothetical protein I303_05390 [Kwoniella dejecticola CBS 10117]